MQTLLLIIAGLILAETSYLTYRASGRFASRSDGDILLDTSVLIDGRIVAIARSGLITSKLIVPRSVVRELQFMADKADHDKRERARFGLDVIEKLQQISGLSVEITDDGATSEHGVDEQLILLAQRTGAKLCTIDYNLNKAARVQSVEIININEMAHALRVVHLPGEHISVELVQPGQDKKQAVGYLDDGTMVVVEDSREKIGQSVAVELTRVLQTAAGRMMFAKRISSKKVADDTPQRHSKSTQSNLSQSRGEAEGRGRMVANEKSGLQSPGGAKGRHQNITKPNPVREAKKPRPQNPRRGKGRRTTPEDTLVDLANK